MSKEQGFDYDNDPVEDLFDNRIKDYYGAELNEEGQALPEPDKAKIRKRDLPKAIIEIDDGVTFYEPPTDKEKWFTIGSESYIPDRQEYIMEAFKKEFKHLKGVKSVEDVGALASRSPRLAEWLNKKQLEYSLEAEVPLWAKEIIPSQSFKDLQKSTSENNILERSRSEELTAAAREYKNKIKTINNKFDEKISKIKDRDMVLALTANSTTLPLTIQLAIESYSPSDSDAPTQKNLCS